MSWRWEDDSVGKASVLQVWGGGLSSNPQDLRKKLGVSTDICNINTGEAESGGSLELTGQPA